MTSATLRSVPFDLAPYFTGVKYGALAYLTILTALQFAIVRSERIFQWLFRKRGGQSRSAAWIADFRSAYELLLTKGQGAICFVWLWPLLIMWSTTRGVFFCSAVLASSIPGCVLPWRYSLAWPPCFPHPRRCRSFRRNLLGGFGQRTAAR